MDVVDICVPTPLRKTKDPDVSYIVAAVKETAPRLKRGQLVVLESTTYPGTTDELVLPMLAEGGLQVGKDFFLAFSPERVDPGNETYQTKNIPKVVGGVTPDCTRLVSQFYGAVMDSIVPVGSTRVAEMVKLLENTFRSVNIGLVNELALMCDRMGIDVWEVIDAAKTKPFGFMPFYPGPGLGGHCIPIDPFYLSWKARESGFEARFIELAGSVNSGMPHHVAKRVIEALNSIRKPLRGSRCSSWGWPTRRTSTTSANHLARHHGDPRARRRAHLHADPTCRRSGATAPCFAARRSRRARSVPLRRHRDGAQERRLRDDREARAHDRRLPQRAPGTPHARRLQAVGRPVARYLVTGGPDSSAPTSPSACSGTGTTCESSTISPRGSARTWTRSGRRAPDASSGAEEDVRDADACRRACAGVDFVFHEAALGSVPRSVERPGETTAVNVLGTVHLFQAAREARVRRVVWASSSSVYGDTPTLPKHEAMPCRRARPTRRGSSRARSSRASSPRRWISRPCRFATSTSSARGRIPTRSTRR